MMALEPSIKSTEGRSIIGFIVGGCYLLYQSFTDKLDPQVIEMVMENSTELLDSTLGIQSAFGMGKSGIVLFFLYKVYTEFLKSRTKLKEKDLDNKASQNSNEV
jgi:hypothetical protein